MSRNKQQNVSNARNNLLWRSDGKHLNGHSWNRDEGFEVRVPTTDGRPILVKAWLIVSKGYTL